MPELIATYVEFADRFLEEVWRFCKPILKSDLSWSYEILISWRYRGRTSDTGSIYIPQEL
jgi:hypothetical protein